MWIAGLGEATYADHPDIERYELDHPFAENFGAFRLKDGVESVSFDGYLPYADAIVKSYADFKRLQSEGVIEPGVRLQIGFPTAHAATGGFFQDVDSWSVLWPAWDQAVRSELTEAWPYEFDRSKDEKFRLFTSPAYVAPLAEGLDEDVALGYHISAKVFLGLESFPARLDVLREGASSLEH